MTQPTATVTIRMTPEVYAVLDQARREMAELRALAEKVCSTALTEYAIEELADWLQDHPPHDEGDKS
jgi:hypothetical protein